MTATITPTATTTLLKLKGVKMHDETMTIARAPRRRVTFCEKANTKHIITNDLTVAEHRRVWYNEKEFEQMKFNRRKTVKKQLGASPIDDCRENEETCLRGLERLLPGGRQMLNRRQNAIKSIVKLYQQMQTITPEDGELKNDEREKVLSAYSASKTRYAQHTAKYLAAQDAAAVLQDSPIFCGCKKSLQSTPLLTNQHKAVAWKAVNERQSVVECRRVPMRAMTA